MHTKYNTKEIESSGLGYGAKAFFLFTLVSLSCENIFAQTSKAMQTNGALTENLIIIPFKDALENNFRPLHSYSPNGPQFYTLEGDPKSGPSLTIFRYGKNYAGSGNLHNHTHGYKLWLIEGKMKHWGASGSEETAEVLVPGSYIYQPADEFHAANCITKRCTAYVIFGGPIETGFPSNKNIDSEEK